MSIIVTGDIHNEFGRLNELIHKQKIIRKQKGDPIERIICCGDFGYWPKKPWAAKMENIKNENIPVHWCDGNHEDHWALKQRETDELVPNVFYQPRGSYITLNDGRNVMFMGGAYSIDKMHRVLGETWFPEETITHSDVANLPDINVDIMITHTCPDELVPIMTKFDARKYNDPSTKALSYLLEKYQPPLWYFGHWHVYKEGLLGNTNWFALSMPGYTNWWKLIPNKE